MQPLTLGGLTVTRLAPDPLAVLGLDNRQYIDGSRAVGLVGLSYVIQFQNLGFFIQLDAKFPVLMCV